MFKHTEKLWDRVHELAELQTARIEGEIAKNLDDYPELLRWRKVITSAGEELRAKLDDPETLRTYRTAYELFISTYAVEIYLRGVLDGSRLYQEVIIDKLPEDD